MKAAFMAAQVARSLFFCPAKCRQEVSLLEDDKSSSCLKSKTEGLPVNLTLGLYFNSGP